MFLLRGRLLDHFSPSQKLFLPSVSKKSTLLFTETKDFSFLAAFIFSFCSISWHFVPFKTADGEHSKKSNHISVWCKTYIIQGPIIDNPVKETKWHKKSVYDILCVHFKMTSFWGHCSRWNIRNQWTTFLTNILGQESSHDFWTINNF